MRIPIAREGYPFILAALVLAIILWVLDARVGFYHLFYPAISLFLFVVWFFRDPEREIPTGEGDIVSPADGKVIKVEEVDDDRFLKTKAIKISVFMNVFNVHVNRAPTDGVVEKIIYNPGKFINASFDKASLENEQNALIINAGDGGGGDGRRYVANQIAGLIARRIVCRVKEGDTLTRGARFGLIRFGSRLDVFLPTTARPVVKVGEKVSAGSSVLATWQ
ncbi:MAG: phosphatidylserine decarboxylase family protein [Thermodesulfobacteriota bacterium]